jgi:hypothetical protein
VSPAVSNPPVVIAKFVRDGKINITLIAELEHKTQGYFAYLHDGSEVVYAVADDASDSSRLVGFSDTRGKYVAHAVVDDLTFKEFGGVIEEDDFDDDDEYPF